MAEEVTDPKILAAFGAAPADAPATEEVADPKVLSAFGPGPASPPQHPNSAPQPNDPLPFGDEVSLASADNWEEKYLYLSHRYGKDQVSRTWDDDGKPQLVVRTHEGKTYRIGGDQKSPWVAQIAADAPKITGATIGGIAGFGVAGPVGAVAGAGVGAMVGKELSQGVKALYGNYDESPVEGVSNIGAAGQEGAEGEIGGQLIGKGVSKALSGRLPKFLTGATDESIEMTKRAHAAGGLPPYASMGPGLVKLRRVEVIGEKLTGKYAQQDERNMAFVKQEVADTLRRTGMPKKHVEALMDEMNGDPYAVSHTEIGDNIQAAAAAHVESLTAAVDRMAKTADSHIDAQLKNITAKIDTAKHGDLSGDVGAMVESAKRDFDAASSSLYDKALSLAGTDKIVPTDGIAAAGKKIVDLIREASPSQVQAMVRDVSKLAGKPVSESEAIMMHEFGVEIPKDGKLSLKAAQRLRTILRNKAGSTEFTHNTTQHDYGELADAVDTAIQDAAGDPAAKPAIQALNRADAFYKAGIGKFKDVKIDQLMAQIRSGAPPDPERLVQALTQRGFSSRVGRLRSMVGEDVWKRVQSVQLHQWLGRFTETVDGKETLDGLKMLKALRDGDGAEQIRAIHGPQAVTEMREIAEMIAARRGQRPLPAEYAAAVGSAGARGSVLSPADRAAGRQLTSVDTGKADAAFSTDPMYVGKGGAGGDPAKYDAVAGRLGDTSTMPAPSADIVPGAGGEPQMRFTDGRHRFAAMRDAGDKSVSIAMDGESRALARQYNMLSAQGTTALSKGDYHLALESMRAAQARLDQFMNKNALRILADGSKTGEEAYQWIVRPHGQGGDESRILAAARTFGANSPVMMGLRQAALEDAARNASIHAINKAGNNAIETALDGFSKAQRKLLFPDGVDGQLRDISKVIKFMFPFKSGETKDSAMGGLKAGEDLEKPIKQRLYAQAVAGIMRFIALHPWAARWLVTGRDEGTPWIVRTSELFKKMTQIPIMTGMDDYNNGQQQSPGPPPTTMPGPATLQ